MSSLCRGRELSNARVPQHACGGKRKEKSRYRACLERTHAPSLASHFLQQELGTVQSAQTWLLATPSSQLHSIQSQASMIPVSSRSARISLEAPASLHPASQAAPWTPSPGNQVGEEIKIWFSGIFFRNSLNFFNDRLSSRYFLLFFQDVQGPHLVFFLLCTPSFLFQLFSKG